MTAPDRALRAGRGSAPGPVVPHVVILGAGFGGLYAAKSLKNAPVRITIVDRRNHHLFQPLLYQVATAALNPSDIAVPIRKVFRAQANVSVILAEATKVDVAGKRVILRDGSIDYDYLIVATGSRHSYFGNDAWEALAPGLKTVEDALEIRRRVLLAFEAAERETDPLRRKEWMTFVVVGGGPTGIEMAGAMAEIAKHALTKDFDSIDPRDARVIVVEGQAAILPMYRAPLPMKAAAQLARIGVELLARTRVTAIDTRGVTIDAGAGPERIGARTVIWAAGVAASPLAKTLGVPVDRAGRATVNPDLTIGDRNDVYVVGDLASFTEAGKPLPGLAPIAMQQGQTAAENIVRTVESRPRIPFRYHDRGSFSTIGRGKAVGELFSKYRMSGFLAWMAWLVIHIFFLIGFRNRVMVLLGWAYSYLTWQRGARLITGQGLPELLSPAGTATDAKTPQSPPASVA